MGGLELEFSQLPRKIAEHRLDRCAEHFEAQVNWLPSTSDISIPTSIGHILPVDAIIPSEVEVSREINHLKRHKASGSDGLFPLAFKDGGSALVLELTKLLDPSSEAQVTSFRDGAAGLRETGTLRSLVLRVTWPDGYPDIPPLISLDSFYNGHISSTVKEAILQDLNLLVNEQLGAALTFSLIDQLKENSEKYFDSIDLDHLTPKQSELDACGARDVEETCSISQEVKKSVKREQLTKAQKRRQLNRLDENGELPRGWNWVSVVKHLQQHPPEASV
ncbi:unnamed protein product [Echinostoma caproni]|uniref:RWD domain-containing protein n=1 Tax=Echinostoma caproni TaxID=27848 RepID=A0A183B7Y8_9TREM|nr:unnamed protein product [Echinostoma caproni]